MMYTQHNTSKVVELASVSDYPLSNTFVSLQTDFWYGHGENAKFQRAHLGNTCAPSRSAASNPPS